MRSNRGFSFVETLITSVVLLMGLVAVATMFSYSIGAHYMTRQRTTGITLLYEKMEEFRSSHLDDALWNTIDGFDYVTLDGAGYRRVWHVSLSSPRSVTIIVYVERSGLTGRRTELIRATAMATRTF